MPGKPAYKRKRTLFSSEGLDLGTSWKSFLPNATFKTVELLENSVYLLPWRKAATCFGEAGGQAAEVGRKTVLVNARPPKSDVAHKPSMADTAERLKHHFYRT